MTTRGVSGEISLQGSQCWDPGIRHRAGSPFSLCRGAYPTYHPTYNIGYHHILDPDFAIRKSSVQLETLKLIVLGESRGHAGVSHSVQVCFGDLDQGPGGQAEVEDEERPTDDVGENLPAARGQEELPPRPDLSF